MILTLNVIVLDVASLQEYHAAVYAIHVLRHRDLCDVLEPMLDALLTGTPKYN